MYAVRPQINKRDAKRHTHFRNRSMLRLRSPSLIRRNLSTTQRLFALSKPSSLSESPISWSLRKGFLPPSSSKSYHRTVLAAGSSYNRLKSIRTMASASESAKSVHDFTVKDARGKEVDLSNYKGKVLLIVNVASQCGLTNSNYTELTKLYADYKDKGLEILAFPCNQFGGQEPGNNEQIIEFACTRFKAEYPIFDKVDVNGANTSPLYKFLKSSKGGFLGDDIKWNFSKFLVDKDGNVVKRYAPTTSPLSIEKDINELMTSKL